jgi:hypothetical protein
MPVHEKTVPLKRKGGPKSVSRVRLVEVGDGKVAITLYLAIKDAVHLAKRIQKQWPKPFEGK